MNVHKNARLTPQGRALLVRRITEEGWRIVDAAARFDFTRWTECPGTGGGKRRGGGEEIFSLCELYHISQP
jgi:hypothetical protein